MDHISIGVYDYSGNKLCDLYDSFIQAEGQAYNIVYTQELNGWQNLSFNLPFLVDEKQNFRWDYIKSEYLVRMEIGETGQTVEWFVLQKPKATKNSKLITNTVDCPHLSTLLKTKNIYLVFDDETGIGTIDELITRALTNTGWTLGDCDTLLERDGQTEKIRSLQSDGKKGAYQLVIDICNLFKAYPIYHGDTKTVDIHALSNKGPMGEMYIGKNLNAISIERATDNIITRLYVEGEYGDFGYVGIDDVNPTGLSYLMNFDYYKSIGVFTDDHQAAYDTYLADMLDVITSIKSKQTAILAAEDRLTTLWGQINYVIYELTSGAITKTITGGTVTEEQEQIAEGDELYVLKATGNYRVVTAGAGGVVGWDSNDKMAAKFVTLPNGLIGAKQVAIESKEQVVATLTRDKNNQVDPLKQASIQEQIDAQNAAIQELYTGYSSYTLATGGYFTSSGATVDLTSPTADLGWKNCVVECKPGDKFYITGRGGTDQRLWCFVNATNSDIAAIALSASAVSAYGSNAEITAPFGTTHLVCNFDTDYVAALKKHILNGDGLYDEMREAIELAISLDELQDDLAELKSSQLEVEAIFADAMGDMLRDGYWSDQNYAPGQEESLYLDALDVITQMSKPAVTYTFSQVALSEAMGYTERLPEINDKVTVWDEELKLHDVVYVSKRTQYLDNAEKDTIEVTNDDLSLSGQSFESVLSRMSQLADLLQQKNTLYERAGAINADGSIYIDRLNGAIDVMKHKIGSAISNWYTNDAGAIVFESAAGDSAMMLTGGGWMIADGKTQDGDWNWRTAADGRGLVADRITTGYLSADRIEAGSITTNKLSAEVGQTLDISGNQSLNLRIEEIEDDIASAVENAFGQRLEIVCTNGTAFEAGKDILSASAIVYMNGQNVTSQIPAANFSWQRLSDNSADDQTWNSASAHQNTKSIYLRRTDVGRSCVIRCVLSAYSTDNLNISAMTVDTSFFDHSMVKSTHITLEQNKLEIASAGELDVLANGNINIATGGKLNVSASDINLTVSDTLQDELDGLDGRIGSAELQITPSAIVSTVTSSTTYQNAMNSKADQSSLDNYVAKQEFTSQISQHADSIVSTVTSSTTYQNAMNAKADASTLGNYVAKQDFTSQISQHADSIVSTVTSSTTYQNAMNAKADESSLANYVEKQDFASEISQHADSIVSTVTSSTTYQNAMSAKADASALGNYVAKQDFTSEISQHADSIVSTVTGSTTYQNAMNAKADASALGNYVEKTEFGSAVVQNATSIVSTVRNSTTYQNDLAQKADQSDLDSLDTRIETAESNIEQKADSIQFTVLETKVKNMSGVNLLQDSEKERATVREILIDVGDILEPYVDQSICVSFEAKGAAARSILVSPYQNTGISIADEYTFTMPTADFQRFAFTTTVKNWGAQTGKTGNAIRFYDTTGAQNYTIRKIMIELGAMPTSWSPAPEDPVKTLANTVVTIDTTGVAMSGGVLDFAAGSAINFNSNGTFNVFATDEDSAIKFGGTEQNPNFSLGAGGTVKAVNGYFDNLIVQNTNLLSSPPSSLASSLVVSSTQPTGHGIVWIQPSSVSSVDYTRASGGEDMSGDQPSQTLSGFTTTGSALTGSTCSYGVKFKIYNYSGYCRWDRVTVTIQKGNSAVLTIYDAYPNQYVGVGDYFVVNTLDAPSVAMANITGQTGAFSMTVKLYKSDSTSARFEVNENFVIRCNNDSSAAAQQCNVYFIP